MTLRFVFIFALLISTSTWAHAAESKVVQTECSSKSVAECQSSSVGDACSVEGDAGECSNSGIDGKKVKCTCKIKGRMESPTVSELPCTDSNQFGKFPAGGGCNTYGCWPKGGSCNEYGCTSEGRCTFVRCPNWINSYRCK